MSHKFNFDRGSLMIAIKEYLGEVNTAVEVGTHRAQFASVMINRLKPKNFYAVDPLRLFPGLTSKPGIEFDSQLSLDILAEFVSEYLSRRGHTLIRELSETASKQFEDNSLDIVYLDADHSFNGCSNDIDYWYPKVKPGGILAGHDYCNGNTQTGQVYGVIQAVAQLVDEHELDLFVTCDPFPSWMIVKDNQNLDQFKAQAT